jgi:hypothetical protein
MDTCLNGFLETTGSLDGAFCIVSDGVVEFQDGLGVENDGLHTSKVLAANFAKDLLCRYARDFSRLDLIGAFFQLRIPCCLVALLRLSGRLIHGSDQPSGDLCTIRDIERLKKRKEMRGDGCHGSERMMET